MPSSQHRLTVQADDADIRIDVYLTQQIEEVSSRTFIKKLMDAGCVLVNGKNVKANYKVRAGDDIQVEVQEQFLIPQDIEPENIPLDIFYEDEWLLIINKPAGLLIHPAHGIYSGTLVNALLYHCTRLSDLNTRWRPGIVHRLDQETSGLVIVAKDNRTHARLARQFKKHTIKKVYIALVEGEVPFDEGKIDQPLGRHPRQRDKVSIQFDESSKEALTFYRVVKRHKDVTFIKLFPKTGRTHQLRVHMHHLNHPILGDAKYGDSKNFSRMALHAQSIGFFHPETKKFMELTTQIPKEFLDKVSG